MPGSYIVPCARTMKQLTATNRNQEQDDVVRRVFRESAEKRRHNVQIRCVAARRECSIVVSYGEDAIVT
jgi:hypothetical protein